MKVLAADGVPERFRPWLYRIARNHCLNKLRSAGRRRDAAPLPTELDVAASLTGALSRLENAERAADLARLLDRLSDDERELLRLRYAEDLSRKDIAAVLEVSEQLVKTRLYEAVRKLRLGAE